jgi:hypothetical protein
MAISDIAEDLNTRSSEFAIGELQSLRVQIHDHINSPRTSKIFTKSTMFDNEGYAFHDGGRQEMQFNIAYEGPNADEFRYGLAFSLQLSQNLSSIDLFEERIQRYNEFLSSNPDYFADLLFWYYAPNEGRSSRVQPGPITSQLFSEGNFLFIGKVVQTASLDTDEVLRTFDSLLPLYQYVEGFSPVPQPQPSSATPTSFQFRSGLSSGAQNPSGNATFIDIVVRRSQSQYDYYEIKTSSSIRQCLREAIPQLLEYSFWPGTNEAERLVVVSENSIDEAASQYLETLRTRFELPIFYRQYDTDSGTLSQFH